MLIVELVDKGCVMCLLWADRESKLNHNQSVGYRFSTCVHALTINATDSAQNAHKEETLIFKVLIGRDT